MQLPWPLLEVQAAEPLRGSGCVGKGDSCPCLLAGGQGTAKVLPPAQTEPSLPLNSLTLLSQGEGEGWSESKSDLPGRMYLLMLYWAET